MGGRMGRMGGRMGRMGGRMGGRYSELEHL